MTAITSSPLILALIAAVTYFIHEYAGHLVQLLLMAFFGVIWSRPIIALVNKLLHGPIQELKALAEGGYPLEGVEVRRRLLALEGLGLRQPEGRTGSL